MTQPISTPESKRPKIELLVMKFDSFDREAFTREALEYTPHALIYVINFDHILLEYQPPGFGITKTRTGYTRRGIFATPLLQPLASVMALLALMRFALVAYLKYRPQYCVSDHSFTSIVFGLFRRYGKLKVLVHILGDWLVIGQKRGVKKLGNEVLVTWVDRWCGQLADRALYLTDNILQAKAQFWKRQPEPKEGIYNQILEIKKPEFEDKKLKILFMGRVLPDSGLDLVLDLLPDLHQKHGITFKVIGPPTVARKAFDEEVQRRGLEALVERHSFIETEDIHQMLSDCFVGVNLITSDASHSKYTYPGKILHYFQSLVPVITTENAGLIHEATAQWNLGAVIPATGEGLGQALQDTFERQESYRTNIRQFITQRKHTPIGQYIEEVLAESQPEPPDQ